jgi:uncharacterized membrane protein YbhN (UPF0104 family)
VRRALPALRGLFLVAVVGCAWLGLRGRWSAIGSALGAVSPLAVGLAVALVLLGLLATGLLWRRLLAAYDASLPLRDGLATFFVGQLGKYIPGSVWSLGAQAQLARRWSVPARTTVAAGLLFLGVHLATGVVLGCAALLTGALADPWPTWLSALLLAGALLSLTPPVLRLLGQRVAGRPLTLGWRPWLALMALMALAWSAYALALTLLSPATHDLPALGGAFALAYAAGVVVVLAPAGVGARETLFVLLLAPLTTVAEATALALLARVVHTAADALMAAGWWAVARREGGDAVRRPDLTSGSAGSRR